MCLFTWRTLTCYAFDCLLFTVISSLREPIPGWIDNFNGPVGMLIGSGKGVLRVCYVSEDLKCDFIAVDLCIRGMVIAAWVQATKT